MTKLLNNNVINNTWVTFLPSLLRRGCRFLFIPVIVMSALLKIKPSVNLDILINPGEKSPQVFELKENKPIAAIKHEDPLAATVVVATLFTSKDKNSIYKGLRFETIMTNFQNYTGIHGYDLHIQTELPNFKRSPLCKPNCLPIETKWYKIQVILNLLDKGYEWVFWTDADTLFTNFTKQLPIPLGASDKEIILSGDKYMVNSGHILLHNSLWTRKFLQA